jgi:LCP family protein required for cell wall assembly
MFEEYPLQDETSALSENTENRRRARNTKKKNSKRPKKKKRLFTSVYIVLIVCCVLVFGWIGYVSAYIYPMLTGNYGDEEKAPITEEQRIAFESGQITVLMMGSDRREEWSTSRSDTLMIAFIDIENDTVRLLSIPRDTYITIPTSGEKTKINAAYAYGGVDLTKQTLASNFGIEIDYYFDVDFQGFSDVIDAVGGITINVPVDMYYSEEGIDLDAGVQQLDGDEALQFVRFRSDGQGDLGRIDRQQAFLVALKNELFRAGTLLKIPDICSAVMENMETDFTGTQMLQIMLDLKNGFDLETYQPDGAAEYQNGISYVFINDTGQELMDALSSFGEIPTGIDATTNDLDLSPDGASSTGENSTEEE